MEGLAITTRLDQPQIDLAVALIEQITDFDGLSPVSEHVLLHLRHGGDDQGRHTWMSPTRLTVQAPKSQSRRRHAPASWAVN